MFYGIYTNTCLIGGIIDYRAEFAPNDNDDTGKLVACQGEGRSSE